MLQAFRSFIVKSTFDAKVATTKAPAGGASERRANTMLSIESKSISAEEVCHDGRWSTRESPLHLRDRGRGPPGRGRSGRRCARPGGEIIRRVVVSRPHQPLPAGIAQYSNQTLREIVHASIGGDHVRVRIANTFGTEPLVIGAASIAVSRAGSRSFRAPSGLLLSVAKRPSVPPGAPVLSDPVRLDVKPGADLAVSIYLPNATKTETSTLFQGASYVSPPRRATMSTGHRVAERFARRRVAVLCPAST